MTTRRDALALAGAAGAAMLGGSHAAAREAAGPEANRRAVETFYSYMDAGKIEPAFAMMTDDATWWMPTGKPGGYAFPKEAMRAQMQVFYKIFAELPKEQRGRITAQDDRVCIERSLRGGRTHRGTVYDNDYNILFVFRDGKIAEIKEYLNPTLAAPLFEELVAAGLKV